MTQPDLFTWATAVGGNVVTGLTVTAAQWQSNAIVGDVQYGLIRYTFSGSPDLSGVLTAHRLNVSGFANAANNGTLYIVSADNTAKTITVRMTARLDASLNETGATAPATVTDNGALIQEPSTAKKGQGYIPEEKPNALNFNWALNLIGQWIGYIAGGGALPSYPNAAAVAADPAPANGAKILVAGLGLFEFDDSSSLTADGTTILSHSSGGDGRYLLRIGQGWSRYFAGGAALKAIDTTPLDASCLYRATINVAGLVREYIWIPTGSATAGEPTHYAPTTGPGFWAQVNEQAINYAPAVTTLAVNQSAHGFSALNVVRHNGTAWVTAQANTGAACVDCWITSTVLDADNFVAVKVGRVTVPSHGLTPGATYYLSAASAGALAATIPVGSTTVPLGFYLPVIYVIDANTIDVLGNSHATKNKLLAEYIPTGTAETGNVTFSNLDVHSYGGSLEWEMSFDGNSSNNAISGSCIINGLGGSGKYNINEFRGAGSNFDATTYEMASVSENSGSWNYIKGKLYLIKKSGVSGPVYLESTYTSITNPGNRSGSRLGFLRDNVTNVTQWQYFTGGGTSCRMSSTAGHYIRLYRGDA